jgi:chemotaxis protein MotB
MARRKKRGEEEGKERWLITYADMITLLLALFIVMYAISDVDARKFEAIAKSIREGFGATSPGGAVPMFESGAAAPFTGSGIKDSIPFEVFAFQRIKKIEAELQRIAKEAGGRIEMKYTERGIVISVYPSQILFDTASAQLKPQFQEILRKLGAELVKLPNTIQIEGHTDNRPISTPAFPSNWELSTARAASVKRFLINEFNYNPSKLLAVGYADTKPVAPNDSPENMAHNRRVEIVILRGGYEEAPSPAPQPAESEGGQGFYQYSEPVPAPVESSPTTGDGAADGEGVYDGGGGEV